MEEIERKERERKVNRSFPPASKNVPFQQDRKVKREK